MPPFQTPLQAASHSNGEWQIKKICIRNYRCAGHKKAFLFCFSFPASLLHFKDGSGCHGDGVFVQASATAAFRKASRKKGNENLVCTIVNSGQDPQELVLLCLIKLKWEFMFAEEATVKSSSGKFAAHCFCRCFSGVGLPVAQRGSQISSHPIPPFLHDST